MTSGPADKAEAVQGRSRWERRWWVGGFVVGLAIGLVGAALWVLGRSGAEHRTPSTASIPSVAVAFDPPSRFDFTRAVLLTRDQFEHGTLAGTTLLWVEDGALHLTDLNDPRRSWETLTTDQPQDFLAAPFVIGDIVVVATAGARDTAPSGKVDDYAVNVVGVRVDDGSVVWGMVVPLDKARCFSDGKVPSEDSFPASVWIRQCADLELGEHDGDLLLTFGTPTHCVEHHAMLLDPATGTVRWKSEAMGALRASGRYALATSVSRGDVLSLDMETGKTTPLLDSSSSLRGSYIDPANPAYAILSIEQLSAPEHLRFSSIDGTVESFAPDRDDIRYRADYQCLYDDGQPVPVCRAVSEDSFMVGLDLESAEVRWKQVVGHFGQVFAFHGNIYWGNRGGYSVTDQQTGVTTTLDIGFVQLGSGPPQVNEYGAMGMVRKPRDSLDGKYAWAPASG